MKQKQKPAKSATRQQKPASAEPRSSSRKRLVAACIAAAGLLAVSVEGIVWYRNRPRIPPPTLTIENPDPAVVKLVESARADVLQEPQSADAWGQLGMVFEANEQSAESIACLQQAEALNPDDGRWPYLLGLMVARDRPADALPILRRAADRLEHDVPTARLQLASVLMRLGRTDDGEKEYRRLLAADSANPFAHLGLGKVYLIRERWNEAIAELKLADSDPQTHAAAALLLALAKGRLSGGSQPGVVDVRTASAMSRDPSPPDPVLYALGPLRVGMSARLDHVDRLLDAGRTAEAVNEIRQTTAEYPNAEEAWRYQGRVLLSVGAAAEAEQALRRAIALDPNVSVSYKQLGGALVVQNRLGEAVAALRHSLQLRPNDANTHEKLGHCLRLSKQPKEAVEELRKAVAIEPNQISAHVELAVTLNELGRSTEAIAACRAALLLDPDNKEAQKELADLQAPSVLR